MKERAKSKIRRGFVDHSDEFYLILKAVGAVERFQVDR